MLVDRFLPCLQTLVGCGLSGPTSPLAFSEAVLGAISHNAESLHNKEQLWTVWSAVVSPLTDTITQVRTTGSSMANVAAVCHTLQSNKGLLSLAAIACLLQEHRSNFQAQIH